MAHRSSYLLTTLEQIYQLEPNIFADSNDLENIETKLCGILLTAQALHSYISSLLCFEIPHEFLLCYSVWDFMSPLLMVPTTVYCTSVGKFYSVRVVRTIWEKIWENLLRILKGFYFRSIFCRVVVCKVSWNARLVSDSSL